MNHLKRLWVGLIIVGFITIAIGILYTFFEFIFYLTPLGVIIGVLVLMIAYGIGALIGAEDCYFIKPFTKK